MPRIANLSCGSIAGAGQAGAHGFADRISDGGGAAKPDFGLRRVNIDIDFFQRHFDEQERRRVNAVRQDRAISFRERAANQTIADETAVDEQKLRIARRAALAWRRDKTLYVGNLRRKSLR